MIVILPKPSITTIIQIRHCKDNLYIFFFVQSKQHSTFKYPAICHIYSYSTRKLMGIYLWLKSRKNCIFLEKRKYG